MKRLLSLPLALALCAPAHAANPLTRAEQTVCRNLSHCLSIVETHPHDSYDYAVLADEFGRFGARGQRALIQRLGKDDPSARHAADLLAVMADPSMAPLLEDQIARSTGAARALAERTLEAIKSDRTPQAKPAAVRLAINQSAAICNLGQAVDLAAQKREMPFYEADIARPDEAGRYRPSPRLRVALPRTDRGQLNSAVSRIGGWLAGYRGGLIYYDAATGAPTVVLDQPIHSLQRMDPANVASPVWALSQTEDQLAIFDASAPRPTLKSTLPGRLAELRRAADGTLYASTTSRQTLALRSNGRITQGCQAGERS